MCWEILQDNLGGKRNSGNPQEGTSSDVVAKAWVIASVKGWQEGQKGHWTLSRSGDGLELWADTLCALPCPLSGPQFQLQNADDLKGLFYESTLMFYWGTHFRTLLPFTMILQTLISLNTFFIQVSNVSGLDEGNSFSIGLFAFHLPPNFLFTSARMTFLN